MKRLTAPLIFCLTLALTAAIACAADSAPADAPPEAKPFFEGLWDFIGTLHFATIHLPIGLLMGASIFIIARLFIKAIPLDVPYWCLILGGICAVPALITGFSFAPYEGYGDFLEPYGSAVFIHRWAGVAVCALAMLVSYWAFKKMKSPDTPQITWQLATLFITAMTGWVGSEGGELTHGKTHYDEPWVYKQNTVTPPPPVADDGKIDFVKHIAPIFEATCLECHSADKDKGDFRMHTAAALMKGGEQAQDEPGEWDEGYTSIIAGKPDKSFLVYLLELDPKDDELMPPKKKGGPLTADQIDLIKKWIEQGAHWPDGVTLKEKK